MTMSEISVKMSLKSFSKDQAPCYIRSFCHFYELWSRINPILWYHRSLLQPSSDFCRPILQNWVISCVHRNSLSWVLLWRLAKPPMTALISDGPLFSRIFDALELVRLLRPSVTSLKIPAARCPAIPNCCASFTFATALLSPPSSNFFWLFFKLPMRKRAFCVESTVRFKFLKWHSGGCQQSQCNFLQALFKKVLLPLTLLFLDALPPFWCCDSEDGAVFGVGSARS